MENRQNRNNSEEQKITQIPRKTQMRFDRGTPPPWWAGVKSACTKKDTNRPIWDKLTEMRWKGRITQLVLKRGVTSEINTRSCNPIKEVAATSWRPTNTLKQKATRTVEEGKPDQSHSKSWCRTVVIVVMDMVTFSKVILCALMATVTLTYLT